MNPFTQRNRHARRQARKAAGKHFKAEWRLEGHQIRKWAQDKYGRWHRIKPVYDPPVDAHSLWVSRSIEKFGHIFNLPKETPATS